MSSPVAKGVRSIFTEPGSNAEPGTEAAGLWAELGLKPGLAGADGTLEGLAAGNWLDAGVAPAVGSGVVAVGAVGGPVGPGEVEPTGAAHAERSRTQAKRTELVRPRIAAGCHGRRRIAPMRWGAQRAG